MEEIINFYYQYYNIKMAMRYKTKRINDWFKIRDPFCRNSWSAIFILQFAEFSLMAFRVRQPLISFFEFRVFIKFGIFFSVPVAYLISPPNRYPRRRHREFRTFFRVITIFCHFVQLLVPLYPDFRPKILIWSFQKASIFSANGHFI